MDFKIFDTLLEPVFVLDQNANIIYCNEPAALLADISLRKILRQKPALDTVFSFQENVSFLKNLSAVTEPTSYIETHFRTPTEKAGKVQITAQPITTNTALTNVTQTENWLVFFRDVTLEETLQKKYRAELNQKENVITELQIAKKELENYSKNLEKMVEERTLAINNLNKTLSALLDSLGQAFFLFDQTGQCLNVYSKACENLLESTPHNLAAMEVLKVPEKEKEGFRKWVQALFSNLLPFEDVAILGPEKFPSTQNLEIKLNYFPIYKNLHDNNLHNDSLQLEKVVVVGTDITEVIQLQKEAEFERQSSLAILKLIENKKEFLQFLHQAFDTLEKLHLPQSFELLEESCLRDLHTLKGGFSLFSMQALVELCHEAESKVKDVTDKNQIQSQLSPLIKKMNQELENFVEKHKQILGSSKKLAGRWLEISVEETGKLFEQIITDTQQRQRLEQNLFCESIESYLWPYDRVLTQVAELTNKKVERLEIQGGNIMIRPEPYAELFSSLIHAFRNCVDHGIESPESRWEKGKPEAGRITIHTYLSNEQKTLNIEIADDGGGIPADKIRQKLIQKGIDPSQESDEQVIQHVFDSELSTREQISLTSGRGVGMDAILHAANKIGGHAWVTSTLHKGTTLHLSLPYFTTYDESTIAAIQQLYLQKMSQLLPPLKSA